MDLPHFSYLLPRVIGTDIASTTLKIQINIFPPISIQTQFIKMCCIHTPRAPCNEDIISSSLGKPLQVEEWREHSLLNAHCPAAQLWHRQSTCNVASVPEGPTPVSLYIFMEQRQVKSTSGILLEKQNFYGQPWNHTLLLLEYSDLLNQLRTREGRSRTRTVCAASACRISPVYTVKCVSAGTRIFLILLRVANCFPQTLCQFTLSPTPHESLYFSKLSPRFAVSHFKIFVLLLCLNWYLVLIIFPQFH